MSWLWGVVGAIVALGLSEADSDTRALLLGLLGFAAASLWSRTRAQQRELDEVRKRVLRLESDSRPAPAPTPDVVAAPAPARPAEVARPAAAAAPAAPVQRPVVFRPPPPPEWEVRLRAALRSWFTEGNLPVKYGVPVLLVGVAKALSFAAERGLFSFPVELRLAGIALASMAALAFGWRERVRRRSFGISVQGGALGSLLLTIFAAFRLYEVLPAGAAFALMLIVVAGAACLAVLQDALALAVLSSAGGFMAPVLISTGGGSHVALFSYYALLNAGIVAMVWLRGWRPLSLVGFAFTFVIGTAWGARYYRPELLATTEPFLILFFLCYVGLAVLDSARRSGAARDAVDTALVFGVPLCAFPLQAALLKDSTLALAFSALAVAALYAALAYWALRVRALVTLGFSTAALAIGFAALAVPLALSARWTSGAWVVQGAALIWIGLRAQRPLSAYFGALLQVLAIGAYLVSLFDASSTAPIVNGDFVAGVLVTAGVLFGAYRFEQSAWSRFGWSGFCAAGLVWTVVIVYETSRFAFDVRPAGWAALLASTLAVAGLLRERLPWVRMGWSIGVALVVAFLSSLVVFADGPLHGYGWLAWPLLLGAGLYALRTLARPLARPMATAHAAWLATLATLVGSELYARSAAGLSGSAWAQTGAAAPLALLLWATWRRERIAAFPLVQAFASYRAYWFVPASLALVGWWLWSLGQDGAPAPLGFVPLLNPLELLEMASVLLLYGVWKEHGRPGQRAELASMALAAGLATISIMTLRTVHHWSGEAWSPLILERNVSQTSLSVVWSVLGVCAWVLGSRRGSRPIWLAGALLMGVVLAKLFFVDRRYMGDLPGIVSFVVVGALMVGVGYVAPSPPRAAPERSG